jgi:hypothetical protein
MKPSTRPKLNQVSWSEDIPDVIHHDFEISAHVKKPDANPRDDQHDQQVRDRVDHQYQDQVDPSQVTVADRTIVEINGQINKTPDEHTGSYRLPPLDIDQVHEDGGQKPGDQHVPDD